MMTISATRRDPRLGFSDRAAEVGAVLAMCVLACTLYLQNNDFLLGVHPDENKKVTFILSGTQDFMHPILMLQVSRAVNFFLELRDPQLVVQLGRTVSAVFGAAFVFATYMLAKQILPKGFALVAAGLVATAPLTAIHAQVVKEDIYAAPFLMFALLMTISHARRSSGGTAALLGLFVGLAIAAKFISLLVVPVVIVSAWIGAVENWRRYLMLLFSVALPIVLVVVAMINAPAFYSPETFMSGVGYEVHHSTTGHYGSAKTAIDTWFAHYFETGLIRGLGPAIALAGLWGLLVALSRWRSADLGLKVVVIFAVVWYGAHELSPMKPGVSRYMIAIGPAVCILALLGLMAALETFKAGGSLAVRTLAVGCLGLWPALLTAGHLLAGPDTTVVAKHLTDQLGGRVFLDRGTWHPRTNPDGLIEAAQRAPTGAGEALQLLDRSWDVVVTRNIKGNRYIAGVEHAERIGDLFAELYKRPYVEIKHALPPYEFRNRKFRLVALKDGEAKLAEHAGKSARIGLVTLTPVPRR